MGDSMYHLIVNGIEREVEKDQKLIQYLRDELKLKSVKDGCSEGACGTCTILVDGKATKSCVLPVSKFEGKNIVTVEGLSEQEKEVYVYAFGEAGAVQCGFCIPGMVMCGKALLDTNLNPTREEIAFALRNNICRCTGYKKIVDAIELAAKIFREGGKLPEQEKDWQIGNRVHRVDVREKVLGYGEYVDDVEMEGMVYGSSIRSAYPRAIVKAIHTEKAKALKGVLAVLTAEDVPGNNKVGHLKQDWDTMIGVGDTTRYLGDAICILAAETPEILEEAKKLIEVEYEELPAVFNPWEALKEDAPLVHKSGNLLAHEHLVRGNADEVLKASKHVVTKKFSTPFTEHAFLEPECAIAFPYKDGIKVYTTDQGTYDTRKEVSIMLGFEPERVYIENKLVGGGFGGKEDVTVQHQAALLTYYLKRPVKVKLSRQESILVHPKRHPMDMEFTLGCDEEGNFTALKAILVADTGAYASLGGPVLQRACTHAAGPYNYQTIDIDGKAVYTNNPPAGAFRGFGVTQSCFATECLINLLAEEVGLTPWEIRYKNAIRPGQVLPNGQIADPATGLAETLEAVKEFKAVEHRLEFVRELNNVKWYNDSVSSSPTRTIAGLNSFDENIVLIAGGYDKNLDYTPIAKPILKKVKTLILLGATSGKIFEAVKKEEEKEGKSINIYMSNTLEEAVNLAKKYAKSNEVVLFSPASASFDMFKNFAERGNIFKNLVNKL